MIVLAGRIQFDLLSQLYHYVGPEWGLDLGPRDMRILATYRGIPVLALEEADVPALYVADLARFGHLTRCGLEPEFSVEEIDDAQAEALLQSNPNIVEIPSDRPNTHDERVRQLKLHVRLRLFESYRLEVRDRNAVFAAALIGAAEPALQTAPP